MTGQIKIQFIAQQTRRTRTYPKKYPKVLKRYPKWLPISTLKYLGYPSTQRYPEVPKQRCLGTFGYLRVKLARLKTATKVKSG